MERLAECGLITLPQSEEVPNDGPGPKMVDVEGLVLAAAELEPAGACGNFRTPWPR